MPKSEYKWSETYKPSPSFVSIHLGVEKNLISDNFNCHHIIVENWDELESEKGVIFVSIPTLLCLLYTSPSPRDKRQSRMPSSA